MRISGSKALVTGAVSGLGAATAAALLERGAQVFGLDLPGSIEKATLVPGIEYLAADVTDHGSVIDAVDRVARAADKGAPLRIAVNCAGVVAGSRILSSKGIHDLAQFAAVVGVNLLGSFNVLAVAANEIAQAEVLEDGQRGVVVNTASIAAFEGQIGQVAYAASKGGVVGMTLPAARDLAQHGIRVNTIAPGVVETPMLASVSEEFRAGLAAGVPFPHRLARPDEFARLVCTVIEHDYLNGETIRMDGALRMSPR